MLIYIYSIKPCIKPTQMARQNIKREGLVCFCGYNDQGRLGDKVSEVMEGFIWGVG